jgi:cytochrome bd-type quinol oxidase subunit 2
VTNQTDKPKSSRLGKVSLLLGVLSLVLLCVWCGALWLANKLTFDHNLKTALGFLLTIHWFFVGPFLHFVGLCIGVVALFMKRQKKLLAAFAVLLNLTLPAIGTVLTVFYVLLSAIPPVR